MPIGLKSNKNDLHATGSLTLPDSNVWAGKKAAA